MKVVYVPGGVGRVGCFVSDDTQSVRRGTDAIAISTADFIDALKTLEDSAYLFVKAVALGREAHTDREQRIAAGIQDAIYGFLEGRYGTRATAEFVDDLKARLSPKNRSRRSGSKKSKASSPAGKSTPKRGRR